MNCLELEPLLCEYAEGALDPVQRAQVERHLAECPACARLAQDAAAAVAFLSRVSEVEPPPELVTRIVFQLTAAPPKQASPRRGFWASLGYFLEPVLQPRFAMGMAMTILSFSLLARLAGIEVRQLTLADLDPVKVWRTVDYRAHRVWDRTVKFYDNLQAVYEIRARLRELTAEQNTAGRDEKQAQPNATRNAEKE